MGDSGKYNMKKEFCYFQYIARINCTFATDSSLFRLYNYMLPMKSIRCDRTVIYEVLLRSAFFCVFLGLKDLVESLKKEVNSTKEELTTTQNQVS